MTSNNRPTADNKDRMALDISLLKKQYDKLRERQRQAHIILTTSARQTINPTNSNTLPVNQYLIGRNAIVSKGRRIGPPIGAIPPARKVPVTKLTKASPKQVKRGETLHWKDTESTTRRKNSLTWKDCNNESKMESESLKDDEDNVLQRSPSATSSLSSISESSAPTSTKSRKKSESSSYSEDSDGNSSTSTSLCDDDYNASSMESSPMKKIGTETIVKPGKVSMHLEECIDTLNKLYTFNIDTDTLEEDRKDKVTLSKENSSESLNDQFKKQTKSNSNRSLNKLHFTDDDKFSCDETITNDNDVPLPITITNCFENDTNTLLPDFESPTRNQPCSSKDIKIVPLDYSDTITSTSQLSPIADISKYLSTSSISPLRTPSSFMDFSDMISSSSSTFDNHSKTQFDFQVNDEGVTNQYFERINVPERPSRLELRDLVAENQEDTNTSTSVSSPLVMDLNKTSLTSISSITPPCTEITKIPFEKSPLIHSNSNEFDNLTNQTKSNSSEQCFDDNNTDFESHQFSDRMNFRKEKSYSLDEPPSVRQEFRPTSCPETRTDSNYQNKNSDRVSKIIEENSQILHRILKKNISVGDVEPSFDYKSYDFGETSSKDLKNINETDSLDIEKSFADIKKAFQNSFSELENIDLSSSLELPFPNLDKVIPDDDTLFELKIPALIQNIAEENKHIQPNLQELSTSIGELFTTKACNFDEVFKQTSIDLLELDSTDLDENTENCQKKFNYLFEKQTSEITDYGSDEKNVFDTVLPILSKSIDDLIETTTPALDENIEEAPNQFEVTELSENVDEVSINIINSSTSVSEKIATIDTTGSDNKTILESIVDSNTAEEDTCLLNNVSESTSDISKTLSSIQNTIKSIDSLCQGDYLSQTMRKTSNIDCTNIIEEKSNELLLYDYKENKIEDNDKTRTSVANTPTLHVDKVAMANTIDYSPPKFANSSAERSSSVLHANRLSRDHQRDLSPRRRRDDEREEYESRTQRDRSPSTLAKKTDVLPVKSFYEDFTKLDSSLSNCKNTIDEQDTTTSLKNTNKDTYSTTKFLSLSDYVYKSSHDDKLNLPNVLAHKSHESNLNTTCVADVPVKQVFTDKFLIRHTTVTATFYDRYMSQKLERSSKLDKSPSSPTITKAYLDTLKPPVLTDRNSKSAENSPSRSHFDKIAKDSKNDEEAYMSLPAVPSQYHIKSCDNIPAKVRVNDDFKTYFSLTTKSPKLPDFDTELELYESVPKISP